VETVGDVLEYLAVGASAVQVGTASFADPQVSEELAEGLARLLCETKTFTMNEIRDRFLAENG
jgi:dihydroorotate dehydrogenase